MARNPSLIPALVLSLLLCQALKCGLTPVLAADSGPRFSGFLTLGATRADHETLGFRRDISQEHASRDGEWRIDTDSVLGLQWNWRVATRCDTAAQLLLKQRTDPELLDALEWAFIRCDWAGAGELRLGRLGLDIFMLSDHRNVSYAQPWVRPPHDFYAFLALYHFDGLDYSYRLPWADQAWRLTGFGGRSKTENFVSPEGHFRIEADAIYGLQLAFEAEPWRFRLNHTEVEFGAGPPVGGLVAQAELAASMGWPEAAAYAHDLPIEGERVSYDAIGLGYDDNLWLAQAEWAHLDAELPLLPHLNTAYVSVGRRFAEWTLFTLAGRSKPIDKHEPITVPAYFPAPVQAQLQPLAYALSNAASAARVEQRSQAVGLRWDYASRQALKLQWERFRVEPAGAGLWQSATAAQAPPTQHSQTIRVLSLQWNWLF